MDKPFDVAKLFPLIEKRVKRPHRSAVLRKWGENKTKTEDYEDVVSDAAVTILQRIKDGEVFTTETITPAVDAAIGASITKRNEDEAKFVHLKHPTEEQDVPSVPPPPLYQVTGIKYMNELRNDHLLSILTQDEFEVLMMKHVGEWPDEKIVETMAEERGMTKQDVYWHEINGVNKLLRKLLDQTGKTNLIPEVKTLLKNYHRSVEAVDHKLAVQMGNSYFLKSNKV